MSGMTDFTPAWRKRCTTRGAAADVWADCDGAAAIVWISGSIPALRRSGNRYELSASWSLARSPTITPTLFPPPTRPADCPHWTRVARSADWSTPSHQRYGEPTFV